MKTWIEINKRALRDNAASFERILGTSSALMAVVKANAYGHGLVTVARILAHGARRRLRWFGVDSAHEGITLRRAGIRQPILVLGYTPYSELDRAVKNNLDLTVYNIETVRRLRGGRVHIKIETGTTRQGVGEREALAIAAYLARTRRAKLVGLSTHYANIEDTNDHRYAAKQLHRFTAVADVLQHAGFDIPLKHTAATAATLLFPETHQNLARVGLGLYGLWPSKATRASLRSQTYRPVCKFAELRPVLTWKTIVAQIKDVPSGTPISYGLTERVHRRSRVAVLPVGYSDGYDRGLSSVGNVLIRGRRAKVIGRVCMNMIMVDVTDIPRVHPEDEVVLIGRQGADEITADELASKMGTINYEIVARINPAFPRIIV